MKGAIVRNWFKASVLGAVMMGASLTALPANAAPPDAALFGQLPKFFDAALSPDGKELATIINGKGEYAIAIVDLVTSKTPITIGLGDKMKPRSIVWANEDIILVSLWQSEKTDSSTPFEFEYIYKIDKNNLRKPRLLVRPLEYGFTQFNNVVVDYLEDDPDHILMAFSTQDLHDEPELVLNKKLPSVYKVNVRTRIYTLVERGRKNIQRWYTDQTGTPRIGQGRKDTKDEEWVMRVREAGDKTWRFSDNYPGLAADTDIHGFTSNPNELIISDYRGKNTKGLYVYDLSVKSITRKIFHHDLYDASGVLLSDDGSHVIGASYVADRNEVELLGDYNNGYTRLETKFPDANIEFVASSSDGSIGIYTLSYPNDPGKLIMVNEDTGVMSNLGLQYPGLKSEGLGDVMSAKYTARDGALIPSYVTVPPTVTRTEDLKNLPFIILPHGGPYSRDSKRFDYFAQFFASRGYGVLQMNFRGSAGYGKDFENSGRQNWVLMQDDVEDGARWLIEKGYADPKRTCIAGWSYGGYAALMGAIKHDDLYACAISMAGVTDLKNLIRDEKKYRFGRLSVNNSIASGFSSKDDLKSNSPQRLAEDLKIPLFLAHGTDDQSVHYDHFTNMKRALKKSSADVTYMTFKDEDHFLSRQKNRTAFFKGLDKFLKKHIGESEFAP